MGRAWLAGSAAEGPEDEGEKKDQDNQRGERVVESASAMVAAGWEPWERGGCEVGRDVG